MHVCRTKLEMRRVVTKLLQEGSLGFVPTMGALHEGHVALINKAVECNSNAVVSIFVNPAQFGNSSDLDNYPRSEAADFAILRKAGVKAVFVPNAGEIYSSDDETIVETTTLANIFHGQVRPGHFRGVTTVVARLFNIIPADRAYFGKKDYQQLAVIQKMVHDLHFPVKVEAVETVRDVDGLALSSRNALLSQPQRIAAPILNVALIKAELQLLSGANIEAAITTITNTIETEPLAELKAIDVVSADTFQLATGKPTGTICTMLSVQFGEVLLIDQKELTL